MPSNLPLTSFAGCIVDEIADPDAQSLGQFVESAETGRIVENKHKKCLLATFKPSGECIHQRLYSACKEGTLERAFLPKMWHQLPA